MTNRENRTRMDYKVTVYSKDGIMLVDCYASVATRLVNNERATVLSMINDNGWPKVREIMINKSAEELGVIEKETCNGK